MGEFWNSIIKPPISVFPTPSLLTIPKSQHRFQFSFCSSSSRKFRISAHIGRPRTRLNYLRKKLGTLPLSDNSKEKRQNFDGNSSLTNESDVVPQSNKESGRVQADKSTLLNKLESWVEQYKKDTEFWGIGTGPIFTIFQDSEGKIERVAVNEDEIRRRSSAVDPVEVSFKISFAHDMATEIEKGSNVIPENTSVANFLASDMDTHSVELKTKSPLQGISSTPDFFRKTSMIGGLVLCGLFIVQSARVILNAGQDSKELTRLEKEMLRRKNRSRAEKEKLVKSSVEVMPDQVEPETMPSTGRPLLDKEELANDIAMARGSINGLVVKEQSVLQGRELKDKIEEIRMMARYAREVEKRESLHNGSDEKDNIALKEDSTSNASPKNGLNIPNGSFPGKSSGEDPVLQSGNQYFEGRKKLRIIKSAEEARHYLSEKLGSLKVKEKHEITSNGEMNIAANISLTEATSASSNSISTDEVSPSLPLSIIKESLHASEDYNLDGEVAEGHADSVDQSEKQITSTEVGVSNRYTEVSREQTDPEKETDFRIGLNIEDSQCVSLPSSGTRDSVSIKEDTVSSHPMDENIRKNTRTSIQGSSKEWIEKNFHEFDSVIKEIGVGFVENYQIAKERSDVSEKGMSQLQHDDHEDELEWMKDEKIRNIVFRVRDNELAGKEPFHLISEEDKCSFFHGLGKKVEAENKKLLHLHEYLHSNIENLDYGADGISMYDPPEKIVPRWKVPPAERNPEFLHNLMDRREDTNVERLENSAISRKSENGGPVKAAGTSSRLTSRKDPLRTVIQGSDGSVRAGKRTGKEFWQHTKKWSQGFLECYNAETDPEVKAAMRDMGKDLDRWITEKEIKEAAELMDTLPEKGRDFIKRKLDKVKREMELYGPQAVVSKYREYSEQKEEDYLWWLDLPYLLCIELYTVEDDGEERVGLYSLEMGGDLELDPKQYHVIAFEDAGDCKNLCYIIQAHMEMLGKGHAFVVARPPKDAFREAKANGFSVTVVRKGEVEMNVDKSLEEVEEVLVEIGSKIYHDKITKERSVDINALMKGVLGFSIPEKGRGRRKVRRLMKQGKSGRI